MTLKLEMLPRYRNSSVGTVAPGDAPGKATTTVIDFSRLTSGQRKTVIVEQSVSCYTTIQMYYYQCHGASQEQLPATKAAKLLDRL